MNKNCCVISELAKSVRAKEVQREMTQTYLSGPFHRVTVLPCTQGPPQFHSSAGEEPGYEARVLVDMLTG